MELLRPYLRIIEQILNYKVHDTCRAFLHFKPSLQLNHILLYFFRLLPKILFVYTLNLLFNLLVIVLLLDILCPNAIEWIPQLMWNGAIYQWKHFLLILLLLGKDCFSDVYNWDLGLIITIIHKLYLYILFWWLI